MNLTRLRVDDLVAVLAGDDSVRHVSFALERISINKMAKHATTTVRIPLAVLQKKDCSFLFHLPNGLIEIRVRDVIRTLLN